MPENQEGYLLKCHLVTGFAKKMERLNCTVAEGYPSRAEESGGLRVDPVPQLIYVLNAQSVFS